jgi:hypothetical protein
LFLGWDEIQAGVALNAKQNEAFCNALDAPGLGDALASLAVMAVNAASMAVRHKPVPAEFDSFLHDAATFTVKSCPYWVPLANPVPAPVPTLAPAWPPAGYSWVIGDLSLAWRWNTGPVTCTTATHYCWEVIALAHFGCNRLDGTLDVKNEALGFVIESVPGSTTVVPADTPVAIQFGTEIGTGTVGQLTYLTCS